MLKKVYSFPYSREHSFFEILLAKRSSSYTRSDSQKDAGDETAEQWILDRPYNFFGKYNRCRMR